MIEPRLKLLLSLLEESRRKMRLSRALAIWWSLGALAVLLLVFVIRPGGIRTYALAILIAAILGAVVIWLWQRRRAADMAGLVRAVERDHPDAHPLLSTAFEQRPDAESGQWHFLQQRLVQQVMQHPGRRRWRDQFRRRHLVAAGFHTLAIFLFIGAFSLVAERPAMVRRGPEKNRGIEVEPGDVEVERGTGLVITIRFDRDPPPEATLVVTAGSGEVRRISLQRHLADPLFGASLPEIMESGAYHFEYGDQQTRDYSIRVFEYPALLRADAALAYPAYTGLTNKVIPDTLRITAVEGTRLTYDFQINKPVAQARLVSGEQVVPLAPGSNNVVSLGSFVLTNSGRYALQLVDQEGRTNRRTSEVVVQVLPDRRPDLKLAFPRGDQRVSSLQELQLQAEVADDFGLVRYGLGFGLAGAEPELIELGQRAAAHEKRQMSHLIDLERLNLQADQLVSYFVWADDFGPDGNVRRTYSDMFFAEVRPFDEIFRADTSSGGGEESNPGGQQGGGGGGNEQTRLTELQKQIVIATWKIQREKGGAGSGATKP